MRTDHVSRDHVSNAEVKALNEVLMKSMTNEHEEVNILEAQNKVLKLQLNNLQTTSYSAEGLFDDAQITRNQLLVSNWILCAIIVCGGVLYYKSITTRAQLPKGPTM